MDMDQAAVWLAGSILFVLGAVALVAGIVAINNIIARFWKPVRIFTADSWSMVNPPHRFVSAEELEKIAPILHETKEHESTNQSARHTSQK